MIRNPSRRMTVAQLKERMDARFKAVENRFDAVDKRFEAVDGRFDAVDRRISQVDRKLDAIGEKLDAIATRIDGKLEGHFQILHEHEHRITDLETGRRTTPDVAR
jgi:DNA anti-recombination protein RmuC